MPDNEKIKDCWDDYLQILDIYSDLGAPDDNLKLALKVCLNGGPLLSPSTEEFLSVIDSMVSQLNQDNVGATLISELQKEYAQEAKHIYKELKDESKQLGYSTRSFAFQEALIRICAMNGKDAIPQENTSLNIAVENLHQIVEGVKAERKGFEISEPILSLLKFVHLWGQYQTTPGYPYRPLNHSMKEFRLLVLMPSTVPSATVKCRLIHNTLSTNLVYAALSYVWGETDPVASTAIDLEESSFPVTPNLYSALKHLRHESHKVYLWVDAICIQQSDTEEKNHQVSQMSSIYEKAAVVLMWLGEDEDNSHLAMELLLHLESGSAGWVNIACAAEFQPHLVALKSLLQREYWSRVWIMQEAILAKSPLICCGNYGIKWSTLAFFLLIGELWNKSHSMFELPGLISYHTVRISAADGAATLASLWFYKCLGGKIPMLNALMHSRRRHATNLRDHIFGIAGFAKGLSIKVNYNTPIPFLYQQLAWSTIFQDGNLDILSACYVYSPDDCPILDSLRSTLEKIGNTQQNTVLKRALLEIGCITDSERTPEEQQFWTMASLESLPSWIPRWNHLSARQFDFFYLHLKRHSICNAAAGLPLRVEFLSNDQELAAEGILFDVVELAVDWKDPNVYAKTLAIENGEMPFFLTQFRDDWNLWMISMSSGHENPYGLLQDQKQAFRDTSTMGCFRNTDEWRLARDSMLNEYLGWKNDPSLQRSKDDDDSIMHALGIGASHRYFITKWGYMGKGKGLIKPGDIVVVLYGGNVPFILRPVDSKYHFMGECYVHGIMDGEAVSMRSSGELKEQTFILI